MPFTPRNEDEKKILEEESRVLWCINYTASFYRFTKDNPNAGTKQAGVYAATCANEAVRQYKKEFAPEEVEDDEF